MSQLPQERVRIHQTSEKIDSLLDYVFGQWEDIRWMATELKELEYHERQDLWLEWPLKEDALLQFKQYVDQDLLSATQSERYQNLQRLIEELQPEADRLLRGS